MHKMSSDLLAFLGAPCAAASLIPAFCRATGADRVSAELALCVLLTDGRVILDREMDLARA